MDFEIICGSRSFFSRQWFLKGNYKPLFIILSSCFSQNNSTVFNWPHFQNVFFLILQEYRRYQIVSIGIRRSQGKCMETRRFPEKEANLCHISNKILNLYAWKKLVLQIVRLQWVKDSSNNLFQNCFTSHFCVFFQKLLHLKALTMKPMLFTCWKMEVSRCVLHCSNN